MEWDDVLEQFDLHLRFERHLAENTLLAYRRDLRDLRDHSRGRSPSVMTAEDLRDWLQDVSRAGRSPRTQARKLVAARRLFRFLKARGHRSDDPASFVDLPKVGRPLPRVVSHAWVLRILDLARSSARDTAWVGLMYGSGLRVSEVCNLTLDRLYLQEGFLRVLGKGSKERVAPMAPGVGSMLRVYLEVERPRALRGQLNDAVFPGRSGRGCISRQAVFLRIRRLSQEAGVPDSVSPHVLRHAFATELVRGGADLRSIQTMLGHADLRTTEVYTHLGTEHLRRAYDRAHPRA
ncbi:MAG: tyrosine recombinase [Myxococcota bacterium]